MTGTEDELEALLHFLYAAPVGLVQFDTDGRIEMLNSFAARLLLPASPGRPTLNNLYDALERVAPDLRAQVLSHPGRAGQAGPLRRLALCGPGQAVDEALHADLTLYRLEGGRLMAVLADVTDQVRDERALHRGEARMRFVLEAAGMGDWELDLASGAMTVGGCFDACFGTPPGTPWTLDRLLKAVDDDDRDQVAQAFDQALADGSDWRAEFRVRHAGGGPRWLALHGRPHGAPGQRRQCLGVVFDVTLRREAERAQQEARRLPDENRHVEEVSRLKSRFLAQMSHEIRTPMNAIIGFVQLLLREPEAPALAPRLQKVDRAARHLLHVINDVLDLSKVESGELKLRPVDFEVDALMAQAMEMVAPPAEEKRLELVLDTDHLPRRLRGDAQRLQQALINLLANAVRHTAQGHVRLRGELLEASGAHCLVRFEVQDTGVGIPLVQQAGLFEPFAQGADALPGGTGLGLTVTRQLARLMGGEAGFDSAPGRGSRFWFTARLERAGDAVPPAALAGRRALLVDDLPEARAAIADQLAALGLEVDAEAGAGGALARAALAAAAGRRYDLVLVDWRMAPDDGIATLRALRECLGAAMPHAVLMTTADETLPWALARQAQAAAIVAKPLTVSQLQETLLRLLPAGDRPGSAAPPVPVPVTKTDAETRLRQVHAGRRVLLAEDNPVNQEVVSALLALVGLRVDVAADGREAVEMALAGGYDVVLMDVHMPVQDGLQATREIRARLGSALPVIALTADAFSDDEQACLAAGMQAHVCKPVQPELLFAALLRWLPARAGS